METQAEYFYFIDLEDERYFTTRHYAVKATSEEAAKELLTHSLWIRQGEEQATIDKMVIVKIEPA